MPSDDPAATRLRLDLSYDGTRFRGWAKQPGLRTVQGIIEEALARIAGSAVVLTVAGRTDAGVHSAGQVAHIDLTPEQAERVLAPRRGHDSDPVTALARRVNGVLGSYSDVYVSRTSLAPEGFDARFSAVWRRYEYRLADERAGYNPLARYNTSFTRGELDAAAMNEGASRLVGLHDFAAYCKPRPEATTIRTLLEYSWARDAEGVLIATVKADAFCHSMVRALVGACAAVGAGKLSPDDLARLRDDAVRTSDFKVFPARGLTLAEVGYPEEALLAERAEQTRARRSIDD